MTAVVLIGFNRPRHTARTLEAIAAARPEQLFLVADGPRPGRPDDTAACAEVRAVMDAVDWPCEVHRRYSEVNLGCEGNVETGLDWVFGQVDEAIIFEDDCVADPTFFAYAAELLERYRDDHRVWQVAGNAHGVPASCFGGDSYRFAAWASVWGWATWADRWQRHRAVFPRDHRGPSGDAPVRTVPADPRPELLVTRSGRAHFAEAATSADVVRHGWDKHWWLTMMTEGALAATPAVNMVQNVGFGADATHGVFERETEPALPMPLPLRHPAAVALDVEVERDLELLLARVGGRTVEAARRMVTNPRLRSVGRKVLHSDAMARATRLASRITDRGAPRD
ncbi:hemolytic protein HlpA [Nocardioides maradonensis]